MEIDKRPWGFFEVLADRDKFKVKQIVVNPGNRLSLQRHQRRSELWLVISGSGIVTLDQDQISVEPGTQVSIPAHSWHRIEADSTDDLVFVEIQTGSYFGEDDIERREDDYGRVK